jgi:hypothetical protein
MPVISLPNVYPVVDQASSNGNGHKPALRVVRAATEASERLRPGLMMLLQAYEYAEDTAHDYWDFAVEVADLCRVGMTRADLRWFLCKGWAEQARELDPQPGQVRSFHHNVGLTIDARACMILTPMGSRLTRKLLAQEREPAPVQEIARLKPRWDRDRHELWLGTQPIKQFKLPSPNQEMILMALEEENWPARIDDPLPPSKEIDPKRRLHDTIKNLNRNQKNRLLRFMGDGTGQGVRWELILHS